MCGIAGLLQTPGADERLPLATGGTISSQEAVARMVAQLRHRGPDGCGQEVFSLAGQPRLTLGHTRLAILDLSAAGRQPMTAADGACGITFNGEIYNFRELRARLGGEPASWRSQSDTEVILRAYARWGREAIHLLRGMFAFGLWDPARRELLLARDRLGIKPLYYYAGPGFVLFASEVRALLASGLVPRRLDTAALEPFLAYQALPAPRTLVEGVRSLPPGCWLVVDAQGRCQVQPYWDLLANADPAAGQASAAESRRRVGELLRDSARLHLVSDVPVAAFLSGGIDSTAVVALMREVGAVPRTFTVAVPHPAYGDAAYARLAARELRTDHTEIALQEPDLLEQIPRALAAMDQPTGDGVNTFLLARAVRAHGIQVALSGLGGDELFAGYPSFARLARLAPLLGALARLPRSVRAPAAALLRNGGGASIQAAKLAAVLETDGSLEGAYLVLREVLSRRQRAALLQPRLQPARQEPDPYAALLAAAFGQAGAAERQTLISYAEARTYMHDVLLRDTDQMSMASALEVRVPLLDHRLAEYVMGLPQALKQPGGVPKRLLVESLGPLLPPEIARRPKLGFVLPFDDWLRGPLRAFCEARLAPERVASRGLLRPRAVGALWSHFLARSGAVSWSRVWLLVALEEWLETHGLAAA